MVAQNLSGDGARLPIKPNQPVLGDGGELVTSSQRPKPVSPNTAEFIFGCIILAVSGVIGLVVTEVAGLQWGAGVVALILLASMWR
jgi:hypothetical protein